MGWVFDLSEKSLKETLFDYIGKKIDLTEFVVIDRENQEIRTLFTRVIVMPNTLYAYIIKEMEKIIGPAYSMIIARGVQRYVKEQEISQLEAHVSPEERIKVVAALMRMWRELGFGKVAGTEFDVEKGVLRFRMENSVEADGWEGSEHPVCHIILGYNIALMEWALGKPMVGEEVRCRAKGDPYCEFVIKPREQS